MGMPPRGTKDTPGYTDLPAFSPLLFVGNEVAAAHGSFDAVLSAVVPRDATGALAPHLTTHELHFEDGQGSETAEEIEVARACMLAGAASVAEAVGAGKRTLVHCSWGQNRSSVICCAYAIIHRGIGADEAIAHVRARNLACRHYWGQQPPGGAMHNAVFCELLRELERGDDGRRAGARGDRCSR